MSSDGSPPAPSTPPPGSRTRRSRGTQIANATIRAAQIATRTITRDQIANETIRAAQIEDRTITRTQIADDTIQNVQIANNTITRDQIASSTIRNGQIDGRTITGAKLAANTVTEAELADAVTDSIAAAADYRTGLFVQTEPVSPSGFALGVQAVFLPPALSTEPTIFTSPLGSGTVRRGLTVHGNTLALVAGISNLSIYTYSIGSDTLTALDSRSGGTGLNAVRGLTYYNNRYYVVRPFNNSIYFFVASPLGSDETLLPVSGSLANSVAITAIPTGFAVHRQSNTVNIVQLIDHAGTFGSAYTVAAGASEGIASTDTHFYTWVRTSSGNFTGHAYRLSDGSEDTDAAFDITGGPAGSIEGAAISGPFLWLTASSGDIYRFLVPTDDYRATISGTLTAIQPAFGDVFALTSTADGNKWVRQAQLAL